MDIIHYSRFDPLCSQAFDYVSDLNQLTIDELDDLVEGALMGVLEELVGQLSVFC